MQKFSQHILISFLVIFSFLTLSYLAFAFDIVQTENVSVSALVGTLPTIDTSGGGGGAATSGVRFSGFAYPGATVNIQQGLIPINAVYADSHGYFSIVVPQNEWQLFTLYATDTAGRRSTLLNFPTVLYSGYLTDINGIRFAPTIALDKIAVKKGDFITVEGAAVPNVPAEITFDGPENETFTLSADQAGHYSLTVPLSLSEGEYTVKIRYTGDGRTSKVLRIIVGASTIYHTEATANIPGDCNVDQRITITDFSVLAYWFGKPNPPTCVDTNHDGLINLVDFSILAFYWNQ